jgi:flagellar protein FlaJ
MLGINLKLRKEQTMIVTVTTLLSITLMILGFIYLREITGVFTSVIMISVILLAFPFILFKYVEYKKTKEIEDNFPLFLSDFVEAVRAGMPLPQALKHISKNNYGALSRYVKKMSAQMDWGIPFDVALESFARSSGSKVVGRVVSTIIESHKYGGNLTDIFEAISETSVEIERLREERRMYLQSQMMTGYLIFFIFLIVLIGLQRFLVPSLSGVGGFGIGGERGVGGGANLSEQYRTVFLHLVVLEALFAGLVVGKMSEGSAIAGIKHSFLLTIVGTIIFLVATSKEIPLPIPFFA